MKKMISVIMSIIMAVGCFALTSCNQEKTDGEFIYKYENLPNSGRCYSIIGTTEEGQKYKENVYVPTHFNGLPVYYTFTTYTGNGGALGTNTMKVNCKNLYFNYIQKYDAIFRGKVEYIFIPKSSEAMNTDMETLALRSTSNTVYVSQLTYSYIEVDILDSPKLEYFNKINRYALFYHNTATGYKYSIISANTSYMFNYEDSPNDDYFFINNFESESLIENTPYEPIREGYSFAGWYKEPECINEWNFNKDKLPKFDYDSDGYITNFMETKLYAKWIKE